MCHIIISPYYVVTLRYIPLAEEIQRQMADKAKVWVGITKVGGGWSVMLWT